jgi:hypothetical protein
VNTTKNPCTTFGFPQANALSGLGYAPEGLQLGGACNSIDGSNDYEYWVLNADVTNGTYLADVNRGEVISQAATGSDCTVDTQFWFFAVIGAPIYECEETGFYTPIDQINAIEWSAAWGADWIGYDAADGVLHEVIWTEDGPIAFKADDTLDTDVSTSQLSVDMRTGYYAYIDTVNGLTIIEPVLQGPLLTSPSTTGKAVALSFCDQGCPFASPPSYLLDNSSYLWLIDGTSLERYGYGFNTNTLALQNSAATSGQNLRLSWDRQYIFAWAGDSIELRNATSLALLASFAATQNVVTAHMDLGNNYVYALTGGSISGDTIERFVAYNVTESLFGDGGAGMENPGGPGGAALCEGQEVNCGPDSAAGDQCCQGQQGSLGKTNFQGGFLHDPVVPGDPDLETAGDLVNPGTGETSMRWILGIILIVFLTYGAWHASGSRLGSGIGMAVGMVLALMLGLIPVWALGIGAILGSGLHAARSR